MTSQQQTNKFTTNDLFQWGFLKIMLTTQCNEKQTARKVRRGCFFDKEYMFKNIRVFDFTKDITELRQDWHLSIYLFLQ